MKTPTEAILAMSALGCASAEDIVAWAVEAMVNGMSSDSLSVLAGFDSGVSSFELDEYFRKTKKDLGLIEPTRGEAIQAYAIHLARRILEHDGDFRSIVAKLSRLCSTNYYPSTLMEWHELDDGLCDIEAKNYPFAYDELYNADPRSVVEQAARSFLKSELSGAPNRSTAPTSNSTSPSRGSGDS